MCKKQVKEVRKLQENKSGREDEEISIELIRKENEEEWIETVQVNENPKVIVKFKLDTGVQADMIPRHIEKILM